MQESYIKMHGEVFPLQDMENYVRMGLYDRDTIIRLWIEELLHPSEIGGDTPEVVTGIIDELLAALEEEHTAWPEVTDCSLLDKVFEKLSGRGIVCSHHVGLEGETRFGRDSQEYFFHPNKTSVIGYCCYRDEDMFSSIENDGLMLYFGSIDPESHPESIRRVGHMIVEELRTEGFNVKWDGMHSSAIWIEDFVWQR